MTFRVGQKVVCVDARTSPGRRWYGDVPQVGHIYTVTSTHRDRIGDLVVWLAELKRSAETIERMNDPRLGYNVLRFRPPHRHHQAGRGDARTDPSDHGRKDRGACAMTPIEWFAVFVVVNIALGVMFQ